MLLELSLGGEFALVLVEKRTAEVLADKLSLRLEVGVLLVGGGGAVAVALLRLVAGGGGVEGVGVAGL